MVKIFYKLLRDKLLFSLVIAIMITFILDITLLIFDLIQFIKVSKSATTLAVSFVSFNIVVLVINILVLIFGLIYFLLKRRTIKSKD